jgi:hypothetical protein
MRIDPRDIPGALAVFGLTAAFWWVTPADAQGRATSDTPYCEVLGDLAEAVMYQRQQQLPLSELIDVILIPEANQSSRNVVRALGLEAYALPAYTIEENQIAAEARFRNNVEHKCFERYGWASGAELLERGEFQ